MTSVLALFYVALLQAKSHYPTCAKLCLTNTADACGTADGQSGSAALAACTARLWLARNAARVKHLDVGGAPSAAYASLVACLPALELVEMRLVEPLSDMGCLLEALAWCSRLRTLDIFMLDRKDEDGDVDDAAPHNFPALGCAPAFAKLRSLTKLVLSFGCHPKDQIWRSRP